MEMDFCESICPTAKACMSLDQYKKSVECDVDFKLLAAADSDLMLAVASQVLDSKSDICGSVEAKAKQRSSRSRQIHFWPA